MIALNLLLALDLVELKLLRLRTRMLDRPLFDWQRASEIHGALAFGMQVSRIAVVIGRRFVSLKCLL